MPTRLLSGEGNGTPLQYSCLENPMDGGVWWATVHGVAESRTWLSDFTFTFHSYALEKEMATHSSVLALRIPGIGEPGELPSLGSHRVRHDWSNLAAAALPYHVKQQKEGSHQQIKTGVPIHPLTMLVLWYHTSQSLEQWEMNVCCLSQPVAFCYST